jgi:hypothetical protein
MVLNVQEMENVTVVYVNASMVSLVKHVIVKILLHVLQPPLEMSVVVMDYAIVMELVIVSLVTLVQTVIHKFLVMELYVRTVQFLLIQKLLRNPIACGVV